MIGFGAFRKRERKHVRMEKEDFLLRQIDEFKDTGWTEEQERMTVEKLRELERNPGAYIPAWMRNDGRFRGKV